MYTPIIIISNPVKLYLEIFVKCLSYQEIEVADVVRFNCVFIVLFFPSQNSIIKLFYYSSIKTNGFTNCLKGENSPWIGL